MLADAAEIILTGILTLALLALTWPLVSDHPAWLWLGMGDEELDDTEIGPLPGPVSHN